MATENEVKNSPERRESGKISMGQMAAYGAGGIIPIALFNIAGILVGLMGNISLGLSAFWLGVILIIPRLWDAISDPIIGHFSDNTRTRWGRRRPFLLFGGIAVALSFVAIWWIPKGEMVRVWFPDESSFHWFQLVYILFTLLIFFTAVNIFEIPHGALGMEMTSDYHERTRLFSAKSFVGNLFAMSTPWLFALANLEIFKGPGGNEADGMRYVSILIAVLIIPLSFWWFFKLREPAFKKVMTQKKTPFWDDMRRTASNRNFVMLTFTIFTLAMGFNFVSLLGSYIPIFYIFGGDKVLGATLLGINGTVWAVTGVLSVFPLNWISPRLGKRKTLIVAILLMVTAQLSKIVCYNPEYPYLIIIPTVLLSAGMLFFFTLGSSMVGDICDEDELHTGNRSEGSYYSVFWWFIKMGTALASFVAGALIVFTMFDEGQVTRVDGLQGNVREMKSKAEAFVMNFTPGSLKPDAESEKILALAAEDLSVFNKYLGKEMEKLQENDSSKGEHMGMLHETLQQNQLALQELNTLIAGKDSLNEPEALRKKALGLLTLTQLGKARLNALQLEVHLHEKAARNTQSAAHYEVLFTNLAQIRTKLKQLNIATSPDILVEELTGIEKQLYLLTRQSPFTLLMMRVVEIGLPALLSLFSLFFVSRYSLTEKRSHEIKELLQARNRKEDAL